MWPGAAVIYPRGKLRYLDIAGQPRPVSAASVIYEPPGHRHHSLMPAESFPRASFQQAPSLIYELAVQLEQRYKLQGGGGLMKLENENYLVDGIEYSLPRSKE